MHNNSHTLGAFFARILPFFLFTALLFSCASPGPDFGEDGMPAEAMESTAGEPDANGFVWKTEQFADLKMIRYQVPGWNKLSQDQRKLAYCLTQAGLSGRDMMYDQNNRYNLRVRHMIDEAHRNFAGDRSTKGWSGSTRSPSACGSPTESTITTRMPRSPRNAVAPTSSMWSPRAEWPSKPTSWRRSMPCMMPKRPKRWSSMPKRVWSRPVR